MSVLLCPAMTTRAPDILTLDEAAILLRINVETARRWFNQGKMPGAIPRLGVTYRVSRPALEEFVGFEITTEVLEPRDPAA